MKNNSYNKFNKNTNEKSLIENVEKKNARDYSYYSRVLKKPFESLEELKSAEADYYAEQRAKVDKAATKKADAKKVEEAFKALNSTRKSYKESLVSLTERYSKDLKNLKEAFEADKKEIHSIMSAAEDAYAIALKAFTDKYPEGYHLTLKDGDFETTISGRSSIEESFGPLVDIFNWIFG